MLRCVNECGLNCLTTLQSAEICLPRLASVSKTIVNPFGSICDRGSSG
jgi:hypothetical protein